MSNSSKIFGDNDGSKIELPVFASPNQLIFSPNKRKALLTIFNPYSSEAHFRIMTTSPDRFDVSLIKGVIKQKRRIDISIRLLSQKIDELPEATDESRIVDYFRITIQMGSFKGNKAIKVHWCSTADYSDTDENHVHLIRSDEKASKIRVKSHRHSNPLSQSASSSTSQRSTFLDQRATSTRQPHQIDSSSNVNLVCTICAIACVITLFLPLALDSELCKKAKISFQDDGHSSSTGILSQLGALLSVSYEMKLGVSFALGIFTYRLISTLPD